MIVHLGLGAFHRAHQAVYTEDAGGWEICGVAWRRRTVVDALRAAPGTTRSSRAGRSATTRATITVIREALVAADEPDAVVARIAAAEIVTLTITEGGVRRAAGCSTCSRAGSRSATARR